MLHSTFRVMCSSKWNKRTSIHSNANEQHAAELRSEIQTLRSQTNSVAPTKADEWLLVSKITTNTNIMGGSKGTDSCQRCKTCHIRAKDRSTLHHIIDTEQHTRTYMCWQWMRYECRHLLSWVATFWFSTTQTARRMCTLMTRIWNQSRMCQSYLELRLATIPFQGKDKF